MYHDQLNGLLALKTVADTRNFTAAAKTLGISPSAVSQAIKQLEQRLGVALLSRTTRSTSLTEAGEGFLNHAGPALDQILVALENVGSYAEKPFGLLRLNLPRQLYRFYLAPLVASFIKKHPEITVELFFEDQTSDVIEKGFDAGIRLSDILAKDMVALKLFGPVRFVTAASPEYLDRMGRPKHPEDLLSHNCIRPRLGAGIYERWEFEHKGKEFQVQVKGSLILNDSLLMLEAAVDGAGIVYSTEDAIKDKVRSGKLEIVLRQYACVSDGFYLYYPKRSQVLPKLRAFIEHIKNENRHGMGQRE
jgi:DNA-binding transcriptional LysR family regulator